MFSFRESDGGTSLSTVDRLKAVFGVAGQEDGSGEEEEEEKGTRREHPLNTMFQEQSPMPFELAMLEAMLQEVTLRYIYIYLYSSNF